MTRLIDHFHWLPEEQNKGNIYSVVSCVLLLFFPYKFVLLYNRFKDTRRPELWCARNPPPPTHTHIRTHTRARTHTHTHTHTRTHTHTHGDMLSTSVVCPRICSLIWSQNDRVRRNRKRDHSPRPRSVLLWVYCFGHAGVKGKYRADRLAGKANLTSGLLLGRSELVLRRMRYGNKAKDITLSIAWRREAWEEEALDDLPWRDERGPSSIRQTWGQFQRRRCGKLLRDWVERL